MTSEFPTTPSSSFLRSHCFRRNGPVARWRRGAWAPASAWITGVGDTESPAHQRAEGRARPRGRGSQPAGRAEPRSLPRRSNPGRARHCDAKKLLVISRIGFYNGVRRDRTEIKLGPNWHARGSESGGGAAVPLGLSSAAALGTRRPAGGRPQDRGDPSAGGAPSPARAARAPAPPPEDPGMAWECANTGRLRGRGPGAGAATLSTRP